MSELTWSGCPLLYEAKTMNYVILAAGKGTRLHPHTKNCAKSLLRLGNGKHVLQNTIDNIRNIDEDAKIYVVVGFDQQTIKNVITGCEFIDNPFYAVTNSVASLWFARDALDDAVTIINADVVYPAELWNKITNFNAPAFLCIDSSVKSGGDCNVQVLDDRIIVLSKELKEYYGEYTGVSKLDRKRAAILKTEVERMVESGFYNEWYEMAIMQCVFDNTIDLHYLDFKGYEWAELDSVNDLLRARKITAPSSEETVLKAVA